MTSRNRAVPKDESRLRQGIVAILNSDAVDPTPPPSIRRTLSADMSSKQWLHQNGMRKSVSSGEFVRRLPPAADSTSSDGEEEFNKTAPPQDRVWMSINEMQKSDGWNSILHSRKSDGAGLPPPYVHPLVKRSASGLSEKSLEICTESLGSETGSDCFSSDPDEDKELGFKLGGDDEEEDRVKEAERFTEVNIYKNKKALPRAFPPPIPSISAGGCGSLRIHSRRRNGRLVLEAVSVPSKRCFHAERRGGRLILSLIKSESENDNDESERFDNDESERVFDATEEEIHGGGGGGGGGETTVAKVGQPATAKFTNKNSKFGEPKEEVEFTAAQPVPRLARTIPAASLNQYEYFWRKKTEVVCGGVMTATYLKNRNPNYYYKNLGNGEYAIGGDMRGCKEARRSVSIWEPYCIATS